MSKAVNVFNQPKKPETPNSTTSSISINTSCRSTKDKLTINTGTPKRISDDVLRCLHQQRRTPNQHNRSISFENSQSLLQAPAKKPAGHTRGNSVKNPILLSTQQARNLLVLTENNIIRDSEQVQEFMQVTKQLEWAAMYFDSQSKQMDWQYLREAFGKFKSDQQRDLMDFLNREYDNFRRTKALEERMKQEEKDYVGQLRRERIENNKLFQMLQAYYERESLQDELARSKDVSDLQQHIRRERSTENKCHALTKREFYKELAKVKCLEVKQTKEQERREIEYKRSLELKYKLKEAVSRHELARTKVALNLRLGEEEMRGVGKQA